MICPKCGINTSQNKCPKCGLQFFPGNYQLLFQEVSLQRSYQEKQKLKELKRMKERQKTLEERKHQEAQRAEEEQKRQEAQAEKEQKRQEAQRAEEERKRQEAQRAEEERKRQEAQRAEEERKRQEAQAEEEQKRQEARKAEEKRKFEEEIDKSERQRIVDEAQARRRKAERDAKNRKKEKRDFIIGIATTIVAACIGVFIGLGGFSKLINSVRNESSPSAESEGTETAIEAKRGDRFYLGSYEQDNNIENGTELIEWVVLSNDSGVITAATLYCIDDKAYNEGYAGNETSWENCSLRAWLNDDFYNTAFTEDEQSLIIPVQLSTPDIGNTGNSGENNTTDRVFLLSCADIIQLYPDFEISEVTYSWENTDETLTTVMCTVAHEELQALYTEYARAQHLDNETKSNGENAARRYETETEKESGRNASAWWLRNIANNSYSAMEILYNGSAISVPAHTHIGVRPVIVINTQENNNYSKRQ